MMNTTLDFYCPHCGASNVFFQHPIPTDEKRYMHEFTCDSKKCGGKYMVEIEIHVAWDNPTVRGNKI